MPRIRTVKPEFWEDERVGELSPLARLLFIGTWNLADDEGILRWSPDYLNAALFMYDGLSPKKVRALMVEVERADQVFTYTAGKAHQALAYVVNFRRHQRINKPQPGKHPAPPLQSEAVALMYARRDEWECGACHGPINRELVLLDDDAGALNLALDLEVPRSEGGTDAPTNVRAVHVGCKRSASTGSRNHSGNGTVTDSPTVHPRKGKEGNRERNREGERNPDTRASSSVEVVAPEAPDDDDDATTDQRISDAFALMAHWRMQRRSGADPVRDKAAYVRRTVKALESEFTEQAHAVIAADDAVDVHKLAEVLDSGSLHGDKLPPCANCDSTGFVEDAGGSMAPCPKCQRVSV